MRDTDLAWLAGLLEGEGCFFFGKKVSRRVGVRLPPVVKIQLKMTDLDVVCRAAALMGARDPITYSKPTVAGKPIYECFVSGVAAKDIMFLLLPHMGERRTEKILSGLADWYELGMRCCDVCGREFSSYHHGKRSICSDVCVNRKWNLKAAANRKAKANV